MRLRLSVITWLTCPMISKLGRPRVESASTVMPLAEQANGCAELTLIVMEGVYSGATLEWQA